MLIFSRIRKQYLRLVRYSFANEHQNQQRQQRMQNIKRIREQEAVKRMLDQTQTTSGFNSVWQTIKINKNVLFLLSMAIGITGFGLYLFKNCQVYENPISKKKTILVVNSRKEEDITNQYYENLKTQYTSENLIPQFKQKCEKVQNALGSVIKRVKWGKNGLTHYKIHVVSSKNHIVYLLPTAKVILSSAALQNMSQQMLIFLIRLQQSFYSQNLHVKNVPYGQMLSLLLHNTRKPINMSNENKLARLFSPSFQPATLRQCFDFAQADGQPLAQNLQKCYDIIGNVLRQTHHDTSSLTIRNMFMKFQK